MGYDVAIDLGTAFTAAAFVEEGGPPAMLGLGNRTMQIPSVLYLGEDGTLAVGETAERRGLTDPTRLVREFKRRFGDPIPILVDGVPYSAELLTARLLRWTVELATSRLGSVPDRLMITHPANWGPYKRELLAGTVAQAEVPPADYCTEPEAAAVHYASRTVVETGDRIAVYDLGGGTFDVCVLEKTPEGFAVLGQPDGIEHLGGADVDEAISHHVLGQLEQRIAEIDPADPATIIGLARLRRDCVEAKEALSSDSDVVVPVALPGVVTTVRITRRELETAIRPALLETLAAFRRTLASAAVAEDDLRSVVLVGGSSRIPLVAELLQHRFRVPVSVDIHPKHDVALGAALLARRAAEIRRRPARPPVPVAEAEPPAAPALSPAVPAASAQPPVAPTVPTEPVTTIGRHVPHGSESSAAPPPSTSPAARGGSHRRTLTISLAVLALVALLIVTPLVVTSLQRASQARRDQALIAHLPAAIRTSCTAADQPPTNGAAVDCRPSSGPVASAHFERYPGTDGIGYWAGRFAQTSPNECLGPGDSPTYSLTVSGGAARTGTIACDKGGDGTVVIRWTDDQLAVVASLQFGVTISITDAKTWWRDNLPSL